MSAALACLPSAQGDGIVPPISSTDPANSGLLNTPGFASVPTKLIRRIWGLQYVDMWEFIMWEDISSLFGQGFPPHGIPPDDSEGQSKFLGFGMGLV